jgi:hypothetical protein
VWAASPSDIWAFPVEDDVPSLPVHWDGSRWSPAQAPEPVVAYGVTGTGPWDVWVNGTGSSLEHELLLHYDGTWSYATLPQGSGLASALWAAGPGSLWFGGRNWETGRAILWHGDGAAWTPVEDFVRPVSAIWGTDSDLWVGGADREILRWFQGSWHSYPLDAERVAYLLGVGPDDVLALTSPSSAFHWDGQAWAPEPGAPFASITDFCASAAGYWVASSGKVHHRRPGPGPWTSVPVPEAVLSCAATSDGVVRVFSYNGRILSRQF